MPFEALQKNLESRAKRDTRMVRVALAVAFVAIALAIVSIAKFLGF